MTICALAEKGQKSKSKRGGKVTCFRLDQAAHCYFSTQVMAYRTVTGEPLLRILTPRRADK